jgi:hypothetical protein
MNLFFKIRDVTHALKPPLDCVIEEIEGRLQSLQCGVNRYRHPASLVPLPRFRRHRQRSSGAADRISDHKGLRGED